VSKYPPCDILARSTPAYADRLDTAPILAALAQCRLAVLPSGELMLEPCPNLIHQLRLQRFVPVLGPLSLACRQASMPSPSSTSVSDDATVCEWCCAPIPTGDPVVCVACAAQLSVD